MRGDDDGEPGCAQRPGREHVGEPVVAEVYAAKPDGHREENRASDGQDAGAGRSQSQDDQVGDNAGDDDRVQ